MPLPDWLPYLLAAICGYLAGSVPFGLVLTKMAGLGDIRTIGSGNIGATNVYRTGRKDLALATLLLDSLKAGLVALAFTCFFDRHVGFVAGAAAFAGHCYPIWLKFRGGKGVATYAGLLGFVSWSGLVGAMPVWLAVAILLRISSLAALCAAIAAPIGAYLLGEDTFIVIGLACLSAFVFFTHRANIARLLKGEEKRMGSNKSQANN